MKRTRKKKKTSCTQVVSSSTRIYKARFESNSNQWSSSHFLFFAYVYFLSFGKIWTKVTGKNKKYINVQILIATGDSISMSNYFRILKFTVTIHDGWRHNYQNFKHQLWEHGIPNPSGIKLHPMGYYRNHWMPGYCHPQLDHCRPICKTAPATAPE